MSTNPVLSLSCPDWGASARDWSRFAEEHTRQVLQVGGGSKARVRVLCAPNGQVVLLKDYSRSPRWFAWTLGRAAISNERRLYRVLQGVSGIPRWYPCPDGGGLLVERVQGQSLHLLFRGDLPWEAFEQARRTVQEMHARGVVHGDLGHDSDGSQGRDPNAIWGEDGRLYLVDFASGMKRGPGNGLLFEALRQHDRLFLAKLLHRYFPERREEPEFDLLRQLSPGVRRWLRFLKKL